jgi:hypothetical protein
MQKMNYSAIISALRVRVHQIETAIAELESLNSPNGSQAALRKELNVSRRGRKSMGEAERQQVSERMKAYWARRSKR